MGVYSEFADYDLGQAVAHLSFQAAAMGLIVRQFGAFDRDGIEAAFDVPAHLDLMSIAAVGRIPEGVTQASHRVADERRPLDELVHAPLRAPTS